MTAKPTFGHLPGYPASHGCIRLPMKFSAKLFSVTHVGTPVIVAGGSSAPHSLTHPGLLLTGAATGQMTQKLDALKRKPRDWRDTSEHPVVSVLASGADRKAYLFVNSDLKLTSPLEVKGNAPLGEHVLMLKETKDGVGWIEITQNPDPSRPGSSEKDVIDRLDVSDKFRDEMFVLLSLSHGAMNVIVTDLPATPATRTGDGFVIMNSETS